MFLRLEAVKMTGVSALETSASEQNPLLDHGRVARKILIYVTPAVNPTQFNVNYVSIFY